uniref:Uncharacterized protein n=1 Tax=Candidatus Kentrum sp. DK TaxID=2126562 RepID=A0A450SP93_9GAMM|nr:MAG: hypothetical protein BECKDK2373B_GA0170837_105327 [Candidatus Kentron sp. DK]
MCHMRMREPRVIRNEPMIDFGSDFGGQGQEFSQEVREFLGTRKNNILVGALVALLSHEFRYAPAERFLLAFHHHYPQPPVHLTRRNLRAIGFRDTFALWLVRLSNTVGLNQRSIDLTSTNTANTGRLTFDQVMTRGQGIRRRWWETPHTIGEEIWRYGLKPFLRTRDVHVALNLVAWKARLSEYASSLSVRPQVAGWAVKLFENEVTPNSYLANRLLTYPVGTLYADVQDTLIAMATRAELLQSPPPHNALSAQVGALNEKGVTI